MTSPENSDSPPTPSSTPFSGIAWLFRPVDMGLVAFFRIAFGVVMLIEIGREFANGWIATKYVAPSFHFTYYGFSWVRPWSGPLMQLHFIVLAVLAAMIVAGLFYRVAAVLFFLGISYVFLLDQALYLNHMYLICLMSGIAIFLPAHRKWSLDAKRKPELRSETAPAWTVWLLRFQIGVAYFYGGIAKLDADWISGRAVRLMISGNKDFPLIGPYLGEDWMVAIFAWGGLLFDLAIVPLLLWNRTRAPAFVGAILFHSMNARMFRIGIFPLFMIVASLLFFPTDSLKKEPEGNDKSKRKRRRRPETPATSAVVVGRREWLIAGGLGVYVAFQLLMPLRHLLYPGNVNWTEEGHRFAWHMKLRVKGGECKFEAKDARGNPLELPKIDDVLTERQRRTMPSRPDMVLQYAHFLADELRKQGHENIAIYADSRVSLNGRKRRRMINSAVDLAKQQRSLRHAEWILPMKE